MSDNPKPAVHEVEGLIDGIKWMAKIDHFPGAKFAIDVVYVWPSKERAPTRLHYRESSENTLDESKAKAENVARCMLGNT